jgi:hypothetical protein
MNESIDSEARSCRAALTWGRNSQKSNRPPGSTHESISNASPRTAQTEVESWRELQSRNIEFTMKRLREHDRALAYLCRINLCSARSEVNRRAHRQM